MAGTRRVVRMYDLLRDKGGEAYKGSALSAAKGSFTSHIVIIRELDDEPSMTVRTNVVF